MPYAMKGNVELYYEEAGTGHTEEFRAQSRAMPEQFRTEGAAAVASTYAVGPTRVQQPVERGRWSSRDPRATMRR